MQRIHSASYATVSSGCLFVGRSVKTAKIDLIFGIVCKFRCFQNKHTHVSGILSHSLNWVETFLRFRRRTSNIVNLVRQAQVYQPTNWQLSFLIITNCSDTCCYLNSKHWPNFVSNNDGPKFDYADQRDWSQAVNLLVANPHVDTSLLCAFVARQCLFFYQIYQHADVELPARIKDC